MEKILRKDTLGGVLLIAAAGFFLVNAIGLELGTVDMMGPGLVPTVLAAALLFLGIVLVVKSLANEGAEYVSLPRAVLRAVPLIFAAIVAFVVLLYPTGYIIATFVLVLVAGFASPETRLREIIVAATLLAIGSAFVFVKLLGMPMPLWPTVLS